MAHVTLIWQLLGKRVDLKAAHLTMRFMTTNGKLQKCPSCRYSLAGLPDVHQCPECGFEYDKRMVVIEQRVRGAWIWLCVAGIWLSGGVYKLTSFGTMTVANVALMIGLSCTVYAAARIVFFKKRNTALVWKCGLVFLTADGNTRRRYSWEQIHHVEYALFGGNARLVGHDGSTVDRMGQDFFGSYRQTKAFIEIANRYLTESRGE